MTLNVSQSGALSNGLEVLETVCADPNGLGVRSRSHYESG
jgi:hypothetical protein